MEKKKNLSTPRKFGYAFGITSESVLYNMFFTYFLVFLTDVAFVAPAIAGMIGLISVSWDAVVDPIIGYQSDKKGRDKRKFLLVAAVPMGLIFIAAFFAPDLSDIGKFVYYIAVTIVFWLFYTTYTIPYYALCAEITEDYDERTKIRGLSSFINGFAIFIGAAGPMLLVSAFMENGIDGKMSWTLAAAVMGAIATIVAFIVYFSIKDVELIKSSGEDDSEGLIKTYISIIKLKPFKWLMVFVFFYLAGSSLMSANVLYLLQYRVGVSPDLISLVLLVTVVGMFVLVPIVTWLSTRLDRRSTCIIFFSLEIVGLLILKAVGVDSLLMMLILAGVSTLGTAAFWTIFYSMAYDIVEVDEFVNDRRREGAVTSFPQLVQKIGSAIGLQVAGLTLAVVGYNANAEEQTAQAVMGIENISTIMLAIFVLISLLAMIKYPITKKRFLTLQEELDKKRNGEEYSKEFLKDII